MIKYLAQTSLDREYLSMRQYATTFASIDFSNIVVNKPWGYEYLMYKNPEIEIWRLFIGYQKATSMHCHPNKKTTLMTLDGRALFSSVNESLELARLDTVIIEPGTFHSTQALSTGGLHVLEFETPPIKHDLVRLEDKYGRARDGYEGREKMFADNEHVRFSAEEHGVTKNISKNDIVIQAVHSRQDILEALRRNTRVLGAILSGVIRSKTGEPLYTTADVLSFGTLSASDYLFDNVTMLFIASPDA